MDCQAKTVEERANHSDAHNPFRIQRITGRTPARKAPPCSYQQMNVLCEAPDYVKLSSHPL